ncbi:MAG TPA: hypothetical protein VFC78_01385 [Tepidisphaeraceae bacterium]|nr:hypothetical protein [Tepidisphaeraceae bacterium]
MINYGFAPAFKYTGGYRTGWVGGAVERGVRTTGAGGVPYCKGLKSSKINNGIEIATTPQIAIPSHAATMSLSLGRAGVL